MKNGETINFEDVRVARAKGLYDIDRNMPKRKSHENPAILELYSTYLGEPNGHKAHEILHTSYKARPKFRD